LGSAPDYNRIYYLKFRFHTMIKTTLMNRNRIFPFILIPFLLLVGCSPAIFLTTSQRAEQEADSLMAAERTSEALLAYHQAIQIDPSNHSAAKKLIPLYLKQGRMREADFVFKMLSEPEKNSLVTTSFNTLPQESSGLKINWMKATIHDVPVGLFADIEMMVVSYQSGRVVEYRLSDGGEVWSIIIGRTITSPPLISAGVVLVGCESGELIALDRMNGSKLWKTNLPGAVYARPLADKDRIYTGSYNGKMTALDLATGTKIWQMDAGEPIVNQPIVMKNRLYFGTAGGTVYSLDCATGAALWEKPVRLPGSLEAQPVIVNDQLLMACNDSRIYALDLNGKGYFWQYSTPDSLYASPLVNGDQVYVFSIGQKAAAMNVTTGNVIWEKDLPDPVRSTPVYFSGKLFFSGVSQPYLFEMDAATGQLTDKLNTGDWIEVGPILVDKTLLLAGKDGAVISYRLN
jgi:outer membrane protein assembly factor BamB